MASNENINQINTTGHVLKAHNHLLAKFLIYQFTLPIEHI